MGAGDGEEGEEGLTRFKAVTLSVRLEGTTDLNHVSKFLPPFVENLMWGLRGKDISSCMLYDEFQYIWGVKF